MATVPYSLTLVAALGSAVLLSACGDPPSGAPPQAGTPQVTVMTLQPQRLALSSELPGRVAAVVSAEVRPQVGGLIKQRAFTEGSVVRAGQLLYQIDPATYEAAVASAEATLARAEATRTSARLRAQRQRELVQVQAVSRQDAEDAEASLEQAEADVASARASLQTQRINLQYTRLTAPVTGRIGRSSVTPGALVTANQASALATIQQLDPIYLDVTQSSSAMLALKRSLAQGKMKNGAARVTIKLEDGSAYAEPGTLEFAETSVDATTGTVTMRVRVPNPRGELLPGMYARAVIEEGVLEQALLVPQQAVSRDASGKAQVSRVGADGRISLQPVTAARAIGDQWLLSSGVAAGDRIALTGQQKAQPGAAVQAVPASAAAR
ncbi:efflux RND transporter periplasmic adaptor subunit [Rubrivivax gelatinosus]|uniref:Membrane fusion protein (Multidrug efflux system) n=1 Tax=Rubrivivax gelatinosus TaxID=28068 RepID=A0A4R2MEE5_RUBGE|nr:efflux RND transporter periplasmic adaptor subunit [Rubrivivax gelatinosus]MBK1688790.1 efflux transporter periplasmic adaptor subunit [Rubrivivax gelatinosus]TCP02884.1 membrane fusion protein (multidrug efflux system) [Rubrivivax gelatinosus]